MKGYASNTGTRRNIAALREANWGILLTPEKMTLREGVSHACDNGAWGAHQQGTVFQAAPFERLVERHGQTADFVVVPDIVAGGMQSLDFSLSWLPRLAGLPKLLLPVQDGMDVQTVSAVLHDAPSLGIFLGGSTEWKLRTMLQWGNLAATLDRHYHVGRVDSARRIRLAAEAGAQSFDGTSASRYSCTLPRLEAARQQPSLLAPPRFGGGTHAVCFS